MADRRTPVLLLKTKSSPADSYQDYFGNSVNGAYDPRFVAVLDHRFTPSGTFYLRECIEKGAFSISGESLDVKRYGGLIFTSQRAVEAFTEVVEELRKDGIAMEECLPEHVPIYVVGPATARGVRALNLGCPILGEHTGNGDVLAAFILEEYNKIPLEGLGDSNSAPTSGYGKPGLLFPVGEQRRDIISRTLQSESLPPEQRIDVHELPVYETAVMESFAGDFAREIQPAFQQMLPQWIVVFSPTGCKVMLEGLGLIDAQSGKVANKTARRSRKALIATIGPTTRAHFVREFGFEPDVCSSKPSPSGLGASIAEFEKSHAELVS